MLLFTLLTFLWLLRALLLPDYPDLKVNYFGALHLLHSENPYLPDKHYFTSQVYPPFDMVFFIPLALFPLIIAAKIWVSLSILAILYTIYLCNKLYKIQQFSLMSLFLSSLTFMAFPLKFTLGMGQINTIILLFVTVSFYFLNRQKSIFAGISLAFPYLIKFFPLLLLPYLFFMKKWKVLVSLIMTIILVTLLTLLFYPLQTVLYYFTHILPSLLSSWKGDYYNQALSGLLMRDISDPSLRSLLRIVIPVILLVFITIIIAVKRKKSIQRINLEIASIITLSILINNFSWQHHFVFLLLPYFVIVYTIHNNKLHRKIPLYILLFISYILIAINFPNPNILPVLLQSHVFFGGLLLWILSLVMLVKYKL